jgi:hypothetical protein
MIDALQQNSSGSASRLIIGGEVIPALRNTAVQTGIVISEEKRMALVAQRERILKATAAKELEPAREPTGNCTG